MSDIEKGKEKSFSLKNNVQQEESEAMQECEEERARAVQSCCAHCLTHTLAILASRSLTPHQLAQKFEEEENKDANTVNQEKLFTLGISVELKKS